MQWTVVAIVVISAASWTFVVVDGGGLSGLLFGGGLRELGEFLGRLGGLGVEGRPAFLEGDSWRSALGLAGETLVMSVLAAGLAALGALATVAAGAANLASPGPGAYGTRRALRVGAVLLTRGVYAVSRSVPELIWAMLIVFVFSPGVLAGALALGLHNFGVLGRLAVEVVEDVDPRPLRALRSAGAGSMQVFVYGVMPQVLPQLVTILLYRWEVIIRTTAVVGFVAAAGLGYELRLSLSFFRFTDVGLLLIVYVLLVWAVDLASAGLRRLAR